MTDEQHGMTLDVAVRILLNECEAKDGDGDYFHEGDVVEAMRLGANAIQESKHLRDQLIEALDLIANCAQAAVGRGMCRGGREMGDATRGLYEKFKVKRTDGRSAKGEKHEGCSYFVLDLTHDPFAWPAIHAYAMACEVKFPQLAADLRVRWIKEAP